MEIFTFLKDRQDNKWCSLKKFDFSIRTKKVGRREYFITMFSIFNKISCIQIDSKTNIRLDLWILFGGTNWYICRASLFYIVLYRGFKSFGGHSPLLGLDLWIYCVAGFEVSWVSRIERKEKTEKRKEKVALENTLCLITNYTTHWSLIQHQNNCQWLSVSHYSNWLTQSLTNSNLPHIWTLRLV